MYIIDPCKLSFTFELPIVRYYRSD